jgi:hypothetical protein
MLPTLQAAMSEIQLLTETNKMVSQRVVELEGQLEGGRSSREVALECQVKEVSPYIKQAEDKSWHVQCSAAHHDRVVLNLRGLMQLCFKNDILLGSFVYPTQTIICFWPSIEVSFVGGQCGIS